MRCDEINSISSSRLFIYLNMPMLPWNVHVRAYGTKFICQTRGRNKNVYCEKDRVVKIEKEQAS